MQVINSTSADNEGHNNRVVCAGLGLSAVCSRGQGDDRW